MDEQHPSVLTIILGGGRGTRLFPLTQYRCKPAVPLAGGLPARGYSRQQLPQRRL